MANIPSDFDSDDLVSSEDEETLHPYHNAGKKTVTEMLKFALDDRIASKQRIKGLRDIKGAPKEVIARYQWYNWFLAFYTEIMHKDIKTITPTGEDLARFTAHIIERLKSGVLGKSSYSQDSLKLGIYRITKHLVFEYPDFRLTAHHTSRLQALLHSLVLEGKLLVGQYRKSQWISFLTLRSIIAAYLTDALSNGVVSWDIRICRCLSIVMMSNADSRAGEILRSGGYDGEEYIKWEDITVKLVGGTSFEHLQAQAKILYEKGSKGDTSIYRSVRWRPLEKFDNVVIDPIVLLLIHAMRNGQVFGNTIQEVLQDIADDPHQTLRWENPKWPVIPAFSNTGLGLAFPKAAVVGQMSAGLVAAGRLDGNIRDFWTHDARRGAAKDLKMLNHVGSGVDQSVAAALGHSHNAFAKGVTAKYAERESFFLPNARETIEEDPFAPQKALVPYRKQRLTAHATDEAMLRYPGLNRSQVGRRLHHEHKQAWEQEQMSAERPSSKRRRVEASKVLSNQEEEDRRIVSPKVLSNQEEETLQQLDDTASAATSLQAPDLKGTDYEFIDPRLLSPEDIEAASRLQGLISNQGDKNDVVSSEDKEAETIEDTLIISALSSDSHGPKPLELPVLDFINYFAKINLFRRVQRVPLADLPAEDKKRNPLSGSRGPLEQFCKPCMFESLGCSYKSPNGNDVKNHEQAYCHYSDKATQEQIALRLAPRPFKCSECDKSYVLQKYLAEHQRDKHNKDSSWQPKTCDQGCTSGHVFESEVAYQIHIKKSGLHHQVENIVPQQCSLFGVCKVEKSFTSFVKYRNHLTHFHKLLTEEERLPYLPQKPTTNNGPFKRQPCPIGRCFYDKKDILDRHSLMLHLKGVHKISERKSRKMAGYIDKDENDENDSSSDEEPDDITAHALEAPAALKLPCPLGNCQSAFRDFKKPFLLKKHLLTKQHSCSEDEASQLSGCVARQLKSKDA